MILKFEEEESIQPLSFVLFDGEIFGMVVKCEVDVFVGVADVFVWNELFFIQMIFKDCMIVRV